VTWWFCRRDEHGHPRGRVAANRDDAQPRELLRQDRGPAVLGDQRLAAAIEVAEDLLDGAASPQLRRGGEPAGSCVRGGRPELRPVHVLPEGSDPRRRAGRARDRLAVLAVLKRATLLQLPTLIPRMLSTRARTVLRHRRVEGLPDLQTFHVDAVDDRPFPLQVDGDYIGEFESVRTGSSRAACWRWRERRQGRASRPPPRTPPRRASGPHAALRESAISKAVV
jgi:hypothetical protein